MKDLGTNSEGRSHSPHVRSNNYSIILSGALEVFVTMAPLSKCELLRNISVFKILVYSCRQKWYSGLVELGYEH